MAVEMELSRKRTACSPHHRSSAKPPKGPSSGYSQLYRRSQGNARILSSTSRSLRKRREMRLRFISPRKSGQKGLNAIEEVYKRVVAPMYGCQDAAISKLNAGEDRDCRVAFDPKNDPSTARGMLAYKTSPTSEHSAHGLGRSFEIKTFLLMNTDDADAMGYGTELLRYAAAKALEAGAESMHITVSEEVVSSIAFFIRRGFTVVTGWKGRFKDGITEYLMALRLDGTPLGPARKVADGKKQCISNAGDRFGDSTCPSSCDEFSDVSPETKRQRKADKKVTASDQATEHHKSMDITCAADTGSHQPQKPIARKGSLSPRKLSSATKSLPCEVHRMVTEVTEMRQSEAPAALLSTKQAPGAIYYPHTLMAWSNSNTQMASGQGFPLMMLQAQQLPVFQPFPVINPATTHPH